VVVDGEAEQVGIGGLAVALQSCKEGFGAVEIGRSVGPEDVAGLVMGLRLKGSAPRPHGPYCLRLA
jgi:NCAIR mutase (PurE)-related protein